MSASQNQALILTPDNPSNTTITDAASGETLYRVYTAHDDKRKTTTTYVYDATANTYDEGSLGHGASGSTSGAGQIASWLWHDTRSDELTLGVGPSAKAMPASAWLSKSMIPFKSTVSFKDGQGLTWKWKGVEPGGTMTLFASDGSKLPAAGFQRSLTYTDRKSSPPTRKTRAATLTIDPRAKEIMNLVVVSFLLLEKERRIRETTRDNVASAEAVQILGERRAKD